MHKGYYAIIPADVRYDKDLTPNAKLLYGEITALCNEKGYCWAGNQYFADLYNVSKRTISNWINQLIKKGYIHSEIKYKENSKEVEHRFIRLGSDEKMFPTYRKNLHEGIEKNVHTPIEKKFLDNNTSFNTTVNNTNNKDIVGQPDRTPYKEVVEYLNDKTGKNFRSTTKSTQRFIKARFNEGFTLNDFEKVVDNKVAEWSKDKKMAEYLRPETLFGAKFDSYLNQKVKGGNGYDGLEF